ncbi:hypothetical protein ANN_27188, partial [Periplaneta americana]
MVGLCEGGNEPSGSLKPFVKTHGNRAAGREFTVPEFNIRYWRKQKQALQETNASRKAFRGPKSVKFPDLED